MIPPTPRIAFVTSCKRRAFHIKQTLPQNLADNADYPNAVFIVVDYSSPDDLLDFCRTIDDPRLHVYSYHYEGAFRIAHAKNIGHRLGIEHGAEIIANMDADNFTGVGFARYIAKMFEVYGEKTFLWARMVARCNAEVDGSVCVLPRKHEAPCTSSMETLEWLYPNENERPKIRGIAGRIVVTKSAFLKAGGYDEEKYPTWGPDDVDFNRRLQRLGFVPREISARFLMCVHHSERVRFREYPHAKSLTDSGLSALNSTIAADENTSVVGNGHSGCASLTRLDGTRVTVDSYPNRIFGIGFSKTGTTSLHAAFQTLGYDAAHWTTPRWARNIWEEIRKHGRSLTLEQHEALTDQPIALMYQELDRAYPGSKFILTTRDDRDWLRSIEGHFSAANPWRSTWDNDAFTHRLHTEIYGRRTFDAGIFLARYRRHNAEVREYFRNRPADLLEIRVEEADWSQLCQFLGKPVPTERYPKMNVSR